MATQLSRRFVIAGATAAGSTIIVKPTRAADHKFVQYHNQPAGGTLHKNLVAMWDAVRAETNGRVETTVYPENNKIAGGDPEALQAFEDPLREVVGHDRWRRRWHDQTLLSTGVGACVELMSE